MTRYSTFLFDLDGTLVDSLRDLQQAVNHTLGSYGRREVALDTVRTYVGDGVRALLGRALLGEEVVLPREIDARRCVVERTLERAAALTHPTLDEAVATFGRFYADHLVDHTRCYPGVEEALEALVARGARLAVVSNKPERYTRQILDALGLARLFTAVVGGDTAGGIKPDPAPLTHALAAIRAASGNHACAADRTLMVGDSTNDILAGRAAGCGTGVVTYGFGTREDLAAQRPDFMLEDLRELLEHL
jgi:phosphoglycolate phosphatase